MEPHTYDLKEGNERHVHRSRPKTRFKNEMTPSIPQLKSPQALIDPGTLDGQVLIFLSNLVRFPALG